MYPQQYPAQPAAPQQYAPPMPQYPGQAPASVQQHYPPVYPGQPMQQYAAPAAPVGPPPPAGTLDDYYKQPSSSGGPSFKFQDPTTRAPQVGKSYAGFVARPVTDADIRAQTDDSGRVQTYKDGRPKFVMVVPMQVQPSQEFPEGQAGWWVKGQARDELARAMAEAGAPNGAPEAGAFIRVTLAGVRPIPGRNPAYQYRVEYVRPGGAPAVAGPVEQYDNPSAPVQPAPVAQPQMVTAPNYAQQAAVPMQQYAPPAQQIVPGAATHVTPVQQVPAPVQQVPVAQAAPVAPQVAQQPAPAAPPAQGTEGFTPEQAALFAKLTGQPTG